MVTKSRADSNLEISDALSDDLLREALAERDELLAKYRILLAKLEQEADLIRQLLSLRETHSGETAAPSLALTIASTKSGKTLSPSRHPVVEDVARILEEEGHPIHITEIMKLLEEQGSVLPGRGDQANVIAHLRRDPRFVRPSKGVYGLTGWGLRDNDAMDGVRRRTKKKIRKNTEEKVQG